MYVLLFEEFILVNITLFLSLADSKNNFDVVNCRREPIEES